MTNSSSKKKKYYIKTEKIVALKFAYIFYCFYLVFISVLFVLLSVWNKKSIKEKYFKTLFEVLVFDFLTESYIL